MQSRKQRRSAQEKLHYFGKGKMEKFSINQIVAFQNSAGLYLDHCGACGDGQASFVHDARNQHRHKFVDRMETRFTNAIKRVTGQMGQRLNDEIQKDLAEIQVDNCLTDPPTDEGKILRDANGKLEFTKAGQKKTNTLQNQKTNSPDYEIQPYLVRKIPRDVREELLDGFVGFVITAEQAKEFRAAREVDLPDDEDDAKQKSDAGAQAAEAPANGGSVIVDNEFSNNRIEQPTRVE